MKIYCKLDVIYRESPLYFRWDGAILEFDKDKWIYVDNIEDADIIPIFGPGNTDDPYYDNILEKALRLPNKPWLAFMDTRHIGEGDHSSHRKETCFQKFLNRYDKLIYVHQDNKFIDNQSVYYDFCFDRQKAYFIDYDKFDLSPGRCWTYDSTKKMFELEDIKLTKLSKKFLVPNKTYAKDYFIYDVGDSNSFRSQVRSKLRKIVLEEDCYFSDPDNLIFLLPNEPHLQPETERHFLTGGCGFLPLKNSYYQTSAVSVYVETISQSNKELVPKIGCVSEKTFNPLIKGHYILPFGYQGLIKDLIEIYGFRMPDWIDYNYDNIIDDKERVKKWMYNLSKLRIKSLEELTDLYNKDKDILEYNRSLFFTKPYHSLYEQLKNHISIRNQS